MHTTATIEAPYRFGYRAPVHKDVSYLRKNVYHKGLVHCAVRRMPQDEWPNTSAVAATGNLRLHGVWLRDEVLGQRHIAAVHHLSDRKGP